MTRPRTLPEAEQDLGATERSLAVEPYLMPTEGAWSEDGQAWFAREHYPKRSAMMTHFSRFTDIPYIEVRAHARWMRHAPEDPYGQSMYAGEYWAECKPDDPGAFPVWRCE